MTNRIRKAPTLTIPTLLPTPTFSTTRSPKTCAPKSTATRSSRRAFRPSPTATCTSATPRRSALILAWPTSSAAKPTCASTTPIPKRKRRSTSTPSRPTCAGWASTGSKLCYASDYFGQLYEWALKLVKAGKAYVDDLTADEIRQHRGTLTEPGKDSPYRNRTIDENLDLFVAHEERRIPRRHRACCAPKSTWPRPT